MNFDVYEFSNAGGRGYNEDATGFKTYGDSGIFIVADGLGGHSHGELASSCVRDTLLEGWNPMTGDWYKWMGDQIEEANLRVLSLQEQKKAVMKSTVVVLVIDGNKAVWAHTGDSRLYFVHNGFIQCVTEDHSVAYKKYKAGEIRREDIAIDEDQSQLLRTLGGTDRYEPDIHVCGESLASGDAFLLCSDGAWEYLREEEILIDLIKSENAKRWTELLLLRMMDRISGDNDNLSILAVML